MLDKTNVLLLLSDKISPEILFTVYSNLGSITVPYLVFYLCQYILSWYFASFVFYIRCFVVSPKDHLALQKHIINNNRVLL